MAESGYKRETENGRGGRYQGATAAKRQASLQDMGILNPAMAASLHTLAADSNVASERRSSKHASPSFGDASLPGRTRTGFDPRINSDALIYEKGPSANNVLKHIMIRLSAQFSELLFLSAEAQARFNQNRDNGDLDIAIHGLLKALYLPVPSHLFRAGAMGVLGECLAASYKESGRPRDIKESIRYCKGGLLLSSPDDQGQVALFTNLGCALNIAFEEGGNIEDLTEAIQSHRKALAIRSPDDNIIEKSQILMNLSGGLKELYEQTGVIRHLEEAIVNLRGVSPLVPAGHSRRPHFLINLAISLRASHERNGSDRDLEEAISLLREALLLDQERASILPNLAHCLHDRFHKKGKVEDLEEAVQKFSEAVDLHPAGHPSTINPLIQLGGCLNILYEQLGRIKDLEEGIRCLSLALKLSSPGSLNKARCLHNLGTCLRARYEHSNHFEDQDMAIQCLREALRLFPKSSSHHRTALQNLSHCLLSQHKRQGTSDALDEATRSLQEILHLYPPNHAHRPVALNNLASCLETQYEQNGNIQILEEAIQHHKDAIELCPPGHPSRTFTISHLPRCLIARYNQHGQIWDLREAIEYLRQCIQNAPSRHPVLCPIQSLLASVYADNSSMLKELGYKVDHWEALFEEATSQPVASFQSRIQAALKWITRVDGKSSLRAYQRFLELADQYLLVRSSISSKHQLLQLIPSQIASNAAAEAIDGKDVKRAVELLEQGRTLIWSQLNRYRTPLDSLMKADPNLGAEFMRLSQLLEHSAIVNPNVHLPEQSMERDASRYSQIAEDWTVVVERIRQIEGFDNFLRPQSFSSLQQSSTDGPVIVINISAFRCDAIIILKSADPILVHLVHARLSDLQNLALTFDREIRAGRVDRTQILGVLRALWDDVVQPVVEKLQELGIASGSRIWWCPTSVLATLPLHAAGPYRRNRPNLCDIYISSYTPTLSALAKVIDTSRLSVNQASLPPSPRLLVVAQPNTPGQPHIPCVREELGRIQKLLPPTKVLFSEGGTCDNVLAGLSRHHWVHFMCHGSQSRKDPFQSCFHLHDKSLTLLDIVEARLPDAQFAFLSACHSAANDMKTPDETIHLAAALQFVGFRSVIGTMYAMADIDGPMVAEEVYKHLFRRKEMGELADYRDAAEALSIATRKLRDKGVPVERWINFVHFGA